MVGRLFAAIARLFRRGPKIIVHHDYVEDTYTEPRLGEDIPEIDESVEEFMAKHGHF